MLTKTRKLTLQVPQSIDITPELESIVAAVFDEYSERKSDEQLRSAIAQSSVVDYQVNRIRELYTAWNV